MPTRTGVLSGKAAFDRVLAARQQRSSRYFRFHYLANGLGLSRLGMAVSRRVDRRAVVRNRLRRQIRESFRLAAPALPSLDVVVFARPEAARAPRAEVWRDLLQAWTLLAR